MCVHFLRNIVTGNSSGHIHFYDHHLCLLIWCDNTSLNDAINCISFDSRCDIDWHKFERPSFQTKPGHNLEFTDTFYSICVKHFDEPNGAEAPLQIDDIKEFFVCNNKKKNKKNTFINW